MDTNFDTKSITEDILKDIHDSSNYSVSIYQKSEGDTGGTKISNVSTEHDIKIESTDNITVDKADLTYSTVDLTSQVFITLKSNQNKVEFFTYNLQELLNRRLSDFVTDEGWDKIEVDDLSIEDPSYQKHQSTLQITFIRDTEDI